MSLLPRRFEKIKSILNCRMGDLTILVEEVEKPHNLSAILRTCDAVGVFEAHAIHKQGKEYPTFNSTAQGSQKWVNLHSHRDVQEAITSLKTQGFKLYGTQIGENSCDYRDCDFTGPTAFILGAEKWGLSKEAKRHMDQSIFIPMRGMVQSLNVSVAAAVLLFEALRQREAIDSVPTKGEGLEKLTYKKTIFEWAYPEVALWCKENGIEYPKINENGEIIDPIKMKKN